MLHLSELLSLVFYHVELHQLLLSVVLSVSHALKIVVQV
jgi:hypothetical protein